MVNLKQMMLPSVLHYKALRDLGLNHLLQMSLNLHWHLKHPLTAETQHHQLKGIHHYGKEARIQK